VQASTSYARQHLRRRRVAAHPKRFIGVFSVDVCARDALERMRDWTERA